MDTPASELPRGTVTFLFTDIERSTELVRELGADYGRLRGEHHRLLRDAFGQYGGHEIDTAGDGFFVVFERAGEAVAAAVAAQRALHAPEQAVPAPLRVRMGLHSAEPYVQDDGYLGVGVSRAARICAAGHGGQILLSNATAGIVEDLGLEGAQLKDLGEHELKDLERPQRLFQLVVDGLPSEFPPLTSLDSARSRPAIVSLLYTDLTGWRHVMRTLGDDKAAAAARAYHGLGAEAAKAEGGRQVEALADTTMSVFEWPRDALRAAIRLRDAIRTEPWLPAGDRPDVRMAIHSGRIADSTSSHLGLVALQCTSLCDDAEPGQIVLSHATEALLEGGLPEVGLRDLGERMLPNLDHPVHVYEVEA